MDVEPVLSAGQKWPLSRIICYVFVIIYIICVRYDRPAYKDECVYLGIAKSIVKGDDFSIFKKPSIVVPAWPYLLSNITALNKDIFTTIILSRLLSTLLTILNLFLITAFFKRIKVFGNYLSDYQIVILQLLTFGNFYFMAETDSL